MRAVLDRTPVRGDTLLLLAGALVVAANLRPAVASVPPILGDLRQQLGLSAASAALLASVPVLCFGALSPLAPRLRRRFGEERVMLACLACLVLGLGLRAGLPETLLFPGTLLAAGAIAVMNVLSPSLIKHRFPQRVGGMLGLYTLTLNLGATVAAGATAPVYDASGGSVTASLGMWALLALVGLLAWTPQLRASRAVPADDPPAAAPTGRLLRSRLAWQVTLFMGLQSLLFYATLSWLPTLYRDRGADATDAGLLLSLATFAGIASAFVAPMIGQRRRDQRAVTAATVLLTASGLAGTIAAPVWAAPLFMIMLGLGQGAAIALALLFMILRTPDAQTSAALSGMAQTIGYLLAATGPLVTGLLHTASGGWTVPVLFLLALVAVEFGVGLAAARDRTLHM